MKIYNKSKEYGLEVDASADNVTVLESRKIKPGEWKAVIGDALDNPIGSKKLEEMNLENKKVCIITDDWGRPTPVSEFLPQIIDRLKVTRMKDKDLCIVTGSGMHDPMSEQDLRRKVGDEVVSRYRCYVHDGGNRENLEFVGIAGTGTPVWVNKHVVDADFVIVAGRVYPHITYGYEGGYKMICPGVSSFETIVRDHSLNFAATSTYGNLHNNCSRDEADSIGRMVGIDFTINFVVNRKGEPVKAYAGDCDDVFSSCVKYGEHNVWYRKVDQKSDITIIACGNIVEEGLQNNPTYYIGLAMNVTKDYGTIVLLLDEKIRDQRRIIDGVDIDQLSMSELLYMHEKRDWRCNPRQIQHYIKSIRGSFYMRRNMVDHIQKLIIVSDFFSPTKLERFRAEHFTDLNEAYQSALKAYKNPQILVVPDAVDIFPLLEYSYP